jgi:hypothetical protein
MPLKAISYDNVYFYKIICRDLNIKDLYVGHTTDFNTRKRSHKNCCNNKSGNVRYHATCYKFIRDNGGWDNWDMVLIDKLKCDDKLDALRKERKYIEDLNANLNMIIPSRTNQEWVVDNRDHIKDYKHNWHLTNIERIHEDKKEYYVDHREYTINKVKEYYKNNKDKCKEWKNGLVNCECGFTYTNANKARHQRTIKHQNYLKSISEN